MSSYIDVRGLSVGGADLAMVQELTRRGDLPTDAEWLDAGDRLALLARLVHGAGVTIYTGPFGAAFWSLASIEVKVRIVPDGTDYEDRAESPMDWALRTGGMTPTQSRSLRTMNKKPTKRSAAYEPWMRAEARVAALSELSSEPIIIEPYPVIVIADIGEQARFLQDLGNSTERTAEDWEWDPDDNNAPVGLAVSVRDENYYLPVQGSDMPYDPEHGVLLREAWAWRLHIARGPVVMHNGRSDLGTQYPGDPAELCAKGGTIDDTIVMAYLCGESELDLKGLTRRKLDRDPLDYPGALKDMPVALAARYAGAGDTRNTLDLYHVLEAELEEKGQTFIYENVERELVPVIASMEKLGSPIDPVKLQELRVNLGAMEDGLRADVWARHHFDIADSSGKDEQTRMLVKALAGYDPGTVRKDALARIEDDWMDSVLGFRQIRHRRRAFIDKHLGRWRAAGSPEDFRGYVRFNQAGSQDPMDVRSFKRAPRSGRLSSSGDFGNFQNQPSDIRSIFIAPPGCELFSFDYSGLELHIAAALSGDPEMLRVLKAGEDLHGAFQQKIAELTGVDVGRVPAKSGNFNAQYGGGPDQLMIILGKQRAHISFDVAEQIVEAHRRTYKVYHDYAARVVAQAKANGGYSTTLFGRRRYDMDIFSGDASTRQHAERALVNHTIQGTAADILKMVMVWCQPLLAKYGAHLSKQVHDEVVGWVPTEHAGQIERGMVALMESIELPGLPLKVTGGCGASWAEVH
jgi:DNA polymerase I-like protein with 3'-5' exonuclease and polymerase domains